MTDYRDGPFGDVDAPLPGRKPIDTENHKKTRTSGRHTSVHETKVFKFRDPRTTRVRIYKSGEGLPWAITDLVKKTSAAIEDGDLPGKPFGPGDVVQAAIVSYFCGGKVHKPQTTPDSPGYATLPYKIVIADGGYWTAEPALPAEALIHFNLPVTVGDLIPNLSEQDKEEVLISLQIKEATYASEDDLQRGEHYATPPFHEYEEVDTHGRDESGFMRFMEHDAGGAQNEVSGEWRDLTGFLDDVARDEDVETRVKRKLSERHNTDRFDFGFGKKR